VKHVPKETKPPLVVRCCTFSPRSSGGGIGDQLHSGAFLNEFPRSCSSCTQLDNNENERVRVKSKQVQSSTTDLEEGCRDGQVRVVPETHGEHGVYLARILQAHSNTRHSLAFRLE
jgi:hypothetical protein